ncbi:MAG: hypothetical protein NXI31_13890 [bacterium]|nr:hypothetical protein [bacterium]
MPLPTADSPIHRLQLGFAGPDGGPRPHLSVDGMTPEGPNLSHWPGNRTPAAFKADLSTGIAFRFVRAGTAAHAEFLGDVDWVVNDHYDTDGFASLLAILQPEIAAPREELLLAAAATGDFGCWQTWRGFAVDRIVANIARSDSPAANVFARIDDPAELALRRYEWLLDNAVSILDHPGGYRALYEEEMARVEQEIDAGIRGAIERTHHRELGFTTLASNGPRHRMTLNTLAGTYRVLHTEQHADGPHYRYHDRTESWFELVTLAPPPRHDLRPLAERLTELEAQATGATPDGDTAPTWNADPPTAPIPELYHGIAAEQEYGQITRELAPSALSPATVEAEFVRFFATRPNNAAGST